MAPVKPRKYRGRSAPPPPKAMPRLAKIKLEGAAYAEHAAKARKDRKPGVTLAGALIIGGAAIAGASWIGGNLFSIREAVAASADGVATAIGFTATIDVEGVEGQRRKEVAEVVLPDGRKSIVGTSPRTMKDNVESLDWVESATVQRRWPSTIKVSVQRRDAFALWQENGTLTVVDAAGERVHGAPPSVYKNLPRIVGAGAGPAAEPVLHALEELPLTRARLAAFVRVGERRWNLNLKNGLVVMLPEEDPVGAMARLENLQTQYRVMDGAYIRLDLREPGRLIAQPRPPVVATTAAPREPAPRLLPQGA
ncbi:MAG: cell division protein FtsQ/DivIB [Alphaproteobacteria bacterium]|nr:cell division protein FtsQ/DivIB [Alphaproteobacteria bacterium]